MQAWKALDRDTGQLLGWGCGRRDKATLQNHWFGRFKRKSILITQSKEMVDLTIALCTRFWVNGNQDEIISLLT
jgi:IS1 family transposase